MAALMPLVAAAAPAAVTALMVGAAKGAGNVLGKAAAEQTVETAGDIKNKISSFGQPSGTGQQRVVYLASAQPQQAQIQQPYYG